MIRLRHYLIATSSIVMLIATVAGLHALDVTGGFQQVPQSAIDSSSSGATFHALFNLDDPDGGPFRGEPSLP